MTRTPLALALAAAGSALVAHAAAQDFAGADALVIEDAIGTVTLTASPDGTLRVSGTEGAELTLTATGRGGTVRLAGPERLEEDRFWDAYAGKGGVRVGPVRLGGGGRSVTIRDGRDRRFEAMLEGYPDVTVAVPEGTDLRFEGSALRLSGDVALGRVEADGNLYLVADLGDADSAELDLTGPGRLALGDVANLADATLSGSGDVGFGRAGSLVMSLKGSGDMAAGDVDGEAALTLAGSGDVDVGRVGGGAEVRLRGSGDVELAGAAGGLDVELAGSGDVEVAEVAGDVRVSLRGSGDVDLASGRADALEVDLSGSGDVAFGGVAVDPVLRTRGSGSIVVSRSEGRVDAQGDGIRVAGQAYGEGE